MTDGGRIYVHAINITGNPEGHTVLDIQGGDMPNSFFHIGGMKVDAGAEELDVLSNVDSGDGLTHVRFTDAHWSYAEGNISRVRIDRSSSTSGQTVLEFVGCKDMTHLDEILFDNVIINGASSDKPSRVITRDCELANDSRLVKPAIDGGTSEHYADNRRKNWVLGEGVKPDDDFVG